MPVLGLVPMDFCIDQWTAWAPGLRDQAAWRSWLSAPWPLQDEGTAPLSEMPPMLRRRVERLGRVALQAAYRCPSQAAGAPIVFASRYGDLVRSAELLTQLAEATPLSPTSFSLSVHNAIGALYSIARGDVGAYTAVAAGAETMEAAFVEAGGLLADGAPEVIVVVYDEPVPAPWKSFSEYADFPRAVAFRLLPATAGAGFTLSCRAPEGAESSGDGPTRIAPGPQLAPDLRVLQFLDSAGARFEHRVGARSWRWERHA